MTLDIRLPMGLLFTLIGLLLVIFGLTHGARSAVNGININAAWGGVLIVFGTTMLFLAKRHSARFEHESRRQRGNPP